MLRLIFQQKILADKHATFHIHNRCNTFKTMPRATTIQNVLKELDVIINESIATNSRLGLFAYIYRRTTSEIASEIALGHFEDNQGLETLDVAFANLYLDAYKAYKNNQHVSAVWTFAFDNADESLTILQHIMLGMNAHINLDLAVATATTMSGQEILDIVAHPLYAH